MVEFSGMGRAVNRERLRVGMAAAIAQSAGAYGYTLSVWTSGAALIHQHGAPNLGDVMLFLGGAVTAFGTVTAIATRGFHDLSPPPPAAPLAVAGALHFISAGVAVGAVMLIGVLLNGQLVWPIAAFALTAIYLCLTAVQVAIGHHARGVAPPTDRGGEVP